jgi:hypothetical protein
MVPLPRAGASEILGPRRIWKPERALETESYGSSLEIHRHRLDKVVDALSALLWTRLI